ncbi:MAG: hypothetical protein ACXQT3_00025, partial [Methermicoccaceae archaeon]
MIGTRLFVIIFTINLLFVVANGMGEGDYSFTNSLVEWSEGAFGWNLTAENNTTLQTTDVSGEYFPEEQSSLTNPLTAVWGFFRIGFDLLFAPLTIFMDTGMPWQFQLLIGLPWSV